MLDRRLSAEKLGPEAAYQVEPPVQKKPRNIVKTIKESNSSQLIPIHGGPTPDSVRQFLSS